jgi:hypothetical protein
MKWNESSNGLPKIDQWVIAYGLDIASDVYIFKSEEKDDYEYSIQMCQFIENRYETNNIGLDFRWVYNTHCCEEELIYVTHWMPIPEKPK